MADKDNTRELTPAEIEAEVAKALAEAEKLKAEADRARAQTRKAEAEAEVAEATAYNSAIALERVKLARAKELSDDEFYHVYQFTGHVNSGSVEKCSDMLKFWHRTESECPIEIVFNSPGGGVIEGMVLFDLIRSLADDGHKVTTVAMGVAASMAGILLQAGDHRVMGKEASLLIHEAQFGVSGKIGDVEDTVAWVKKIQGRILDIFAARSKMSKKQIANRWRRKDWWLDSTDALKYGFVDEVRG